MTEGAVFQRVWFEDRNVQIAKFHGANMGPNCAECFEVKTHNRYHKNESGFLSHSNTQWLCYMIKIRKYSKVNSILKWSLFKNTLHLCYEISIRFCTNVSAVGRYSLTYTCVSFPLSTVIGRHRTYIEGILPKGPYLPCVSMAGRALLAGYHRHQSADTAVRYLGNSAVGRYSLT